jgi:23S rRNA pseudouridine1911/1915/1917 synthase
MITKVLYEDKDILVIDKPSGISVHGDGKTKVKTITDWVLKNYPKMKNVGEPMGEIDRPGIVHRLDHETSGVLLLAKNQKAYEFLKKQFQDREIKKTYVAIVNGWVKNDHGVINKPIGRSPSDFRRRLAGRGARGEMREAITEYKVIERFINRKNKFTYLEIKPKTGRTHQIRVHMKYLNHPVVCDSLYNPSGSCPKGISRLALHAKSIEFKNLKGEVVKIESPIPGEFKKVVK